MYNSDMMKNSTLGEEEGGLKWRDTPGDDIEHHQGASPRIKTPYSLSPCLSPSSRLASQLPGYPYCPHMTTSRLASIPRHPLQPCCDLPVSTCVRMIWQELIVTILGYFLFIMSSGCPDCEYKYYNQKSADIRYHFYFARFFPKLKSAWCFPEISVDEFYLVTEALCSQAESINRNI